MSSEPFQPGLIRIQGVTKKFRIYRRPLDRLLQMATLGHGGYARDFTAVHGLDLDIPPGQALGLVGANGAGKSILLQMICGTTAPTEGRIETHGRIYALLQLGAGFHPEFTGRENVYLSGAILGMDKAAVDEYMDDILAFADIGEFVDQPVRTYSSGMFVRLAFSVAVSIRPDILIIDEALAVGDAAFQRRCYHHVRNRLAATRIFVTHDMATLAAMTDRVVVLSHGRIAFDGLPAEGVREHERLMRGRDGAEAIAVDGKRCGAIEVVGSDVLLGDQRATYVAVGDKVTVETTLSVSKASRCCGNILVSDRRGIPVFGQSFGQHGDAIRLATGESRLQFDFRWPRVKAAEYVVSMELEDADGDEATSFDVAIVTGGSIERHPGILAVDLERV